MKILNLLLFIFPIIFGHNAYAQEDSTLVEKQLMIITKIDGRTYTGFILEDDGREILVESKEIGNIYIPKNLLYSIKPYKEGATLPDPTSIKTPIEEKKQRAYENLHTTKYIQMDNAFPLRRGEAFLKFMPVGVETQIPLKKNWSIGAIISYTGAPFILKTKYSVALNKKNYISLDLLYGNMMFGGIGGNMGASPLDGGGAISSAFTIGDRKTNFTIRAGYAHIHRRTLPFWEENILSHYNCVFSSISGMIKTSKKTNFIFDTFVGFGNATTLLKADVAFRFGPNTKHRFQTGLGIISFDYIIPLTPFPCLSYTFIFNKRPNNNNF